MRDMVLVLNFDDAASRAVTRKLRSERVLCKIVPGDTPLEGIQEQDPMGLLMAGGVTGAPIEGVDTRLLQSGLPLLALGDAAAWLLTALGGTVGEPVLQGAVASLTYRESPLLEDVESGERLLQCAREFVLPPLVTPLCNAQEVVLGYAHESLPLFGMQFEVEQNDLEGAQMLRNFALNICGCTTWWDDEAFVSRAVDEIGRVVGEGRAFCAMTGGLDSGVSALLAFKALGSQLKCVFVDSGLLRDREGDDFMAFYRDSVGMDITRVNAQERFVEARKGVEDPEEERRVIGQLMHQILQEEKAKLGDFDALIRGTSYSDIMFRGGSALPSLDDSLLRIEPVRDLFKEEIRRVGDFLGIPPDSISRQPFPGSGLALRIMGEVTPRRLRTLRAADAAFRCELQRSGAAKRLWQFFAVLYPLPGEEGSDIICLRAVQASARSQTYAARLPYDVMENVVDRVLRDQPDVKRIVYDLTPSTSFSGGEWQ